MTYYLAAAANRKRMMNKKLLTTSFILVFIAGLLSGIAIAAAQSRYSTITGKGTAGWNATTRLEANQAGYGLVSLLETIKSQSGNYPVSLHELEIYFNISIKPLRTGNPNWYYQAINSNDFALKFSSQKGYYPCEYYDRSTGEWRVDE